jgi:ribonuclease H-related protein
MTNPLTLQKAKELQENLKASGLETTLKETPNPWMVKLTTHPEGNPICFYTNAKGKTTITTHEIKDPSDRQRIEGLLKNTQQNQSVPPAKPGTWIAYTDGSAEKGQCGWATTFHNPEGKEEKTLQGNLGPQPNQQIAGEAEAAIAAIRQAITTQGCKALEIRHDLEHIAKWITGQYKPKDPDAKRLVQWAVHAQEKGIPISFQWTKGHEGDPGNERTDSLASQATCLPPTPKIPPPEKEKTPQEPELEI